MSTSVLEGPIVAHGKKCLAAFAIHQGTISLPAETAAGIEADIASVLDAESLHYQNRALLAKAREERNKAEEEGEVFLMDTMQILRRILGRYWNDGWSALGFTNGSLELPGARAERFHVLLRIKAYLEAHPQQELIPMGFTAAKTSVVYEEFLAKCAAVDEAKSRCQASSADLDVKLTKLQKRIRILESALTLLLGPADPIWTAFGFRRPIERSLPSVPQGIRIRQLDPGTAIVSWARATRAGRYRVFIQAEGDLEPRCVATVKGLLAEISGLPLDVKLTFTVTAANVAGESLESEPVEFTLKSTPVG